MTAEQLIAAFQAYLDAGDGYIPGTAGEVWTQAKQDKMAAKNAMVQRYGSKWIGHHVEDCSGAFVRAYKAHGLTIYHGSNAIARKFTVELLPVSAAVPGMAAFKVRKPGEKGYALPTAYRKGPDLNDYYHIGLVDADGQHVINAQSTQTGVVRSKLSDGWDYVGRLKDIQYEGSKEPMQRQVIGGKLNLRAKPDTNSTRVAQIPDGAIVTVDEYGDKWCRVDYNGKVGYAVTQFLAPVNEAEAPPDTTIDQARAALYAAREAIDKALLLMSPAG